MSTYENENEKTVEDRNYLDAETFVELHGVDALQEFMLDETCPDCGGEVEFSRGEQIAKAKVVIAECPDEDCWFGFYDTAANVEKYNK